MVEKTRMDTIKSALGTTPLIKDIQKSAIISGCIIQRHLQENSQYTTRAIPSLHLQKSNTG